ncbi:MAG: hypothetical protein CVV18_02495 [Gammaproteobacteria bacterium HGW-Gammaproteobacteria-8]|nr:MAG: hypothetical protein CVV18_02495 [Gammaproteobacteria bacterium HGW-Gammaproteobacteria-8]
MSRFAELDEQKLAEAALAILSLSSFRDSGLTRAWKGMDWGLMETLYNRGWIENPVGKQKSVVLTEQGDELAATFLQKHFGK